MVRKVLLAIAIVVGSLFAVTTAQSATATADTEQQAGNAWT